ncbi:MAG TPA: MBOAT family O-acyltransferase [Clostridia bacterium]|nr:MBOAT family O-acyltransferase [Clostridia bacterium]
MVFSSLTFLYVFMPIVMSVYYIAPKRLRNLVLLIEGMVFYAWGEPVYIIVVMASTIMDYIYGRLMDRHKENRRMMKFLIVISVVSNLGILAVFKYSSFLIGNLNYFFHLSIPDPHIPLPVGVSFHTFQSMSYTIDMFFGNIAVQRNLVNFCTYVTLFPQMVAGPIVRYSEVEHEIDKRVINLDTLDQGVKLFIRGLAKKVLLANNIGAAWSAVQSQQASSLTLVQSWFGILCFTFQIYFDFSGYSDMAIGLGKMLGFSFPRNFNYPYLSKSITEFWRRWHITLGMWFRNYVYIPLGGNRCSRLKQIRNLLIVWFLTGLWHGASWNFVIWGVYFGVIIILEKFVLHSLLEKIPTPLRIVGTFCLIVCGWVFFEFESLPRAISFFGVMFGVHGAGVINSATIYQLYNNALIFIICAVFSTDLPAKGYRYLKQRAEKTVGWLTPVAHAAVMLLSTAFLVDASYNPFLYFRF